VLNQLDTGILFVDEGGDIQGMNPAGERILGSVAGRRLTDVLVPQDQVWEQEFGTGESRRTLVCRRQILGGGGSVFVIEDITNWRKMEQQIEQDERLAAVGRLAAGLAHEIRNPLASLSGAVQLMADEKEDELHGIVLREVENLNELVEDFLDIARPLQLRALPTDVVSIISDIVIAFEQDPRYQGRVSISATSESVPLLAIDGNRVRQVIWNLVLNAAQATAAEGRIEIRVRRAGAGWEVDVEDEGVGIPIDQVHRIFDPFYTTRSGGTGLGLANVDRIVRAHNGEVGVHSEQGKGTCFTLRFLGDADSGSLEPVEGGLDAS
jgi:two-component system sensor histidine kinase PilS (NtrC family)